MKTSLKPNKLISQTSPYLLQHAYNPVDWYPWGDEAFQKAVNEDKPIFLSIGYSACHWCHVMEHQSFEDNEVAKILNENFVSIKLDREERPDLDSVYMSVTQAMTGSGGWPMTIVMNADKVPFFAGTYFPKNSTSQRIGIVELLQNIVEAWNSDRERIDESINSVIEAFTKQDDFTLNANLDKSIIERLDTQLKQTYDYQHGGFGSSPKFPTPHKLNYLLDRELVQPNEMAYNTIDKMLSGGIYDQIEGGFHRYSTDRYWLLPHFEKMLYDNAQLVSILAKAYYKSKNEDYKIVISETLDFLENNLQAPNGLFYTAIDADSEGHEGKYYVFEYDEIENFTSEEIEFLVENCYFSPEGNFLDEASRQKSFNNIVWFPNGKQQIDKQQFESIKVKLQKHRQVKVKPNFDTKQLCDLNAMLVQSYIDAYAFTGSQNYISKANILFDKLINTFYQNDRLLHATNPIQGMIDDYAYTIKAAISMYKLTFTHSYLDIAFRLTNIVIEEFYDLQNGSFYLDSINHHEAFFRNKELTDNAIPSGNSIMMENLYNLTNITGVSTFANALQLSLEKLAIKAYDVPVAYIDLINTLSKYLMSNEQLAIVNSDDNINDELKAILIKRYIKQQNTLLITEETKHLPLAKDRIVVNNQTTYYYCKNYLCDLPSNQYKE